MCRQDAQTMALRYSHLRFSTRGQKSEKEMEHGLQATPEFQVFPLHNILFIGVFPIITLNSEMPRHFSPEETNVCETCLVIFFNLIEPVENESARMALVSVLLAESLNNKRISMCISQRFLQAND